MGQLYSVQIKHHAVSYEDDDDVTCEGRFVSTLLVPHRHTATIPMHIVVPVACKITHFLCNAVSKPTGYIYHLVSVRTCSPCLATIQQCAGNTYITYCYLSLHRHSLGLVHTRAVRRARVEAAFPILSSIFVSKDKLSVMVEQGAEVGELALCHVPGARTFVFFRLWSVRSPYRSERNSPSMTVVPSGCGSQLVRHQQTA